MTTVGMHFLKCTGARKIYSNWSAGEQQNVLKEVVLLASLGAFAEHYALPTVPR